MKTELIMAAHRINPAEAVIEVWWHGRMIATVTGADGPGVRILSKYPIAAVHEVNPRATPINVIEVLVK